MSAAAATRLSRWNSPTPILQGGANLSGTGNGLSNLIVGNSGNNVLNGRAGNDTLTGGAGNDTFSSTPRSAQPMSHHRRLLGAGRHHPARKRPNALDRIIYNAATGALIYDFNGSAAGGATQFATLSTGLAMTNADFFVV